MSAHASSSSAASGSRPRAAPSQSVPEQVVGNYAVGETIGRGSFGKVKKGRHLFTGEYVAIKILNRQKLKSANMDKKIHREIEILRMFSHPNICRLYEVISTPTDMYLIMEYIEGGELYDYIVQKGRVREPEARYIFQQVVCAIEYCHHFRVVHRDLKPENILLGPGLQVKLIDFGLANIMKDGEFLTTSCGSPNYAAPEVISGKLYYGPEVDVWSCGVILYALLCGCLPFDEDSIPMLFSKIKKGKFVIPPSMAAGPKELIQQILVVDPLVRLTIPQIRDAAWFNLKLPMRLAYNESIFATPEETRIMAVLANECAKKLNIREKDVRRELEVGSGPAYVAYNILLDVRRRKDIAAEVRELGMEERSRSPHLSSQQSAAGAGQDGRSSGFSPKATERELNLGLMLTQSPAMEVLLDRADATTNKLAYNTCGFVPASAQPEQRGSSVLSPRTQTPLSKGSFRITGLSGSQGVDRPGSQSSLTSGSQRRPNPITTAVPSQQLSVSLSDQPRVGSVARKYPMYSAEEESFLVENNYGWRVGLMTDKRADAAFMSVYDVLRLFRMEWKVLAPFKLLCRTTDATWPMLDEVHVQPFSPLPSSPLAAATASTPIRIGQPSKGGAERRSFAGSGSSSPDGGKRMVESAPLPIPRRSPHPTSMLNPSSIASARGGAAAATSSPPTHPVVMTLYLFRIQEKHDKGFLVDFSIERNTLLGFEVVLRLADELVRRVGR